MIGILLLVLGVLALVVPVPRRQNRSVKVGDTKIGIETKTTEKLPVAAGIVLLAGGALAFVFGARKT